MNLESKTIGMRALIHYQLGVCYAMLFHDEDATKNMNLVFDYVRKVLLTLMCSLVHPVTIYIHHHDDRVMDMMNMQPDVRKSMWIRMDYLTLKGNSFAHGCNTMEDNSTTDLLPSSR